MSTRLLELEFKSYNIIKSKVMTFIFKIKLFLNIVWLSVILETYCVGCKKYYEQGFKR